MADLTLTRTNTSVPDLMANRPSGWATRSRFIVRRFPQLVIGAVVIALFIIVGLGAPVFAPSSYETQDLLERLKPPVWAGGDMQHPLGTDEFGRDTLSRLIYGARVSLLVGFFSVMLAGLFGSVVGLLSGYIGGNLDAFLMRIVDIQLSFPYILVAIVIAAFWGAGFLAVIVALSLSGWMGFARTVRSLILGLKDSQYAVAAHSMGATDWRIMFRHLTPNILGPLLVFTTFQVPTRILAEATLSFLGLGIQPPDPSWGNMLSQNRGYIITQPWLVILPGVSLSIVALGANMLGDGLRDFLDPRTRRKQ